MVSLTIDGKSVQVAKGTTILDAAATVGIKIPTMCWLQKVSPTGACRVCVVDIEGVDRPMTACNTPVKDGIKVTTQSPKLKEIRQKMVKLLLVNHPLDCPVCDAAGECDLQDMCHALDIDKQNYAAVNERRKIRYDWSLLESDPNRCILCEKCVKVDHEIVGADAICAVNRGEATVIETRDSQPLNCEFCGNCIAACPTGTLISKPFKFKARPWALDVTKSICAFCSAGCQIEYHAKNGKVARVTSGDDTFNGGNLCINGRFGYSYLNSPARLVSPLVRQGAVQLKADWQNAFAQVTEKLQAVVKTHGAAAVAGIGSPRVTNEENYLFQKFIRGAIGSANIDSEARLGYARAQSVLKKTLGLTGASATIDKIDNAGAVLVFGCDLNAESTNVEYRVIKAATKNNAKLVLANMRPVKLKKFANSHLQYKPGSDIFVISGLMKAIIGAGLQDPAVQAGMVSELKGGLDKLSYADITAATGVKEEQFVAAARLISGRGSVALIFGADVMKAANAEEQVKALANLAILTGSIGKSAGGLFPIDEKNNTQGMLDMGVTPEFLPGYQAPSAQGKDLLQIIDAIDKGEIKALYLLGSDLLSILPNPARVKSALEKLELLVVQDIFATETSKLAHVVLPASAAAEKAGTFTTVDGRVQRLGKAVAAPGEAKEDWEILAELYNRLASTDAKYTPAELFAEIKAQVPSYKGLSAGLPGESLGQVANAASSAILSQVAPTAVGKNDGYALLVGPILFHNGTTSTWSENNLTVAPAGYVELSSADAAKLGISEGSAVKVSSSAGSITGKAKVREDLQAGLLFAPYHFGSLGVNGLFAAKGNQVAVKVEKA